MTKPIQAATNPSLISSHSTTRMPIDVISIHVKWLQLKASFVLVFHECKKLVTPQEKTIVIANNKLWELCCCSDTAERDANLEPLKK